MQPSGHLCVNVSRMKRKFFNVIPGKGTACILLYGPIGTHERVDASDVVAELLSLQEQYGSIDVRINSYGGEVFSGIAICNALRNSTSDINIYIDGIAASIASVIALCGKPLHMSRFARLMLHQVSGGAYGTSDEIRRAAQEAEQAQVILAQIIAGKCRMNVQDVISRYFSGGDHWISAQEALDMGLADSIYDMEGIGRHDDPSTEEVYELTNSLAKNRAEYDKDMGFLEEIRKRPSFKDAASDDDVMRRVTELENDAAKVPALQARVETLEKERDEAAEAARKAFIDSAVSDGRIPKEQTDTFMALMKSDEQNTRKLIDSLPKKKTRVTDFIGGGEDRSTELAGMTWDEIDKAGRLAELKDKHPELYDRKFKETFRKDNQ